MMTTPPDNSIKPTGHAAVVSLSLALAAIFARACGGNAGFVGWDADPFVDPSLTVGWTGGWSVALDAAAMVAAGLTMALSAHRASWRTLLPAGAAVLACGFACAYHAFSDAGLMPGHLRIGAAWTSAFALAAAITVIGPCTRVRSLVFASVIGFVTLLAVKGAVQVFAEHPALVEAVKKNQAIYLQSQGWSADSSMARSYLRRVNDAEASGWFGLSNVYSSLCAAGVAMGLALTWSAWRAVRGGEASGTSRHAASAGAGDQRGIDAERAATNLPLICAVLVTLLAIGGVALGGGKGGFLATIVGAASLGVLAVMVKISRGAGVSVGGARGTLIARAAGSLGPVLVALVLIAVAFRGYLGERFSELSILFRAFYAQAAVRIFGQNPVLGVGPDGFKDAYLLTKNPLNPEEVASPHSIMFDWLACLGLFGGVLVVVLLIWLFRVGHGLVRGHLAEVCAAESEAPGVGGMQSAVGAGEGEQVGQAEQAERVERIDDASNGVDVRLCIVVGVAAVMGGLLVERAGLTPITAAAAVGGMVLWAVIASIVLGLCRRDGFWKIGLAAGAIVLAVHAQIEVSMSLPSSVGIVLAVIAAAAAGSGRAGLRNGTHGTEVTRSNSRDACRAAAHGLAIALGLLVSVAGVALVFVGARPVLAWEATLAGAADQAREVAKGRFALGLNAQGADPQVLQDAAIDLSIALGQSVAPTPSAIVAALQQIEPRRREAAWMGLEAAARSGVVDWRVSRERSRMAIWMCQWLASAPANDVSARQQLDRWLPRVLLEIPDERTKRVPGLVSSLVWQASVMHSLLDIQQRTGVAVGVTPQQLIAVVKRTQFADPSNASHALRLLRTIKAFPAGVADAPSEIRSAAKLTLELDGLARLDREGRGLSEREINEAREAVGSEK